MNTQYEQIIAQFQTLSAKKMFGVQLDARESAFVLFVQQNFVPSRQGGVPVSQAYNMLPAMTV